MSLDFILNGCETKRYHTWPTLRTQNVGEHSCRVALICAWLTGNCPSVALLMAALTHDMAEHKMGDIPAPVKRSMPDYEVITFREMWDHKEQALLLEHDMAWNAWLDPTERRVLKLADAADGCFYCIRERAMGNKLITEVYMNFRDYVRKITTENDDAREEELTDYIEREWEAACA